MSARAVLQWKILLGTVSTLVLASCKLVKEHHNKPMKIENLIFIAALFASQVCATGQGFIFDQQSSATSANAFAGIIMQNSYPLGQSFTPTLTGIDFVQLAFRDKNIGNNLGATVFMNVRSDSITGTILGTTAPVSMPDGFGAGPNAAIATFFFASTVSLQPETLYYLEPIVQSGDQWVICDGEYFYFRGTEIGLGTSFPASDLWFREGILVPEPSALAVVLLGAGVLAWMRRGRRGC